jgi:hypothetical protein
MWRGTGFDANEAWRQTLEKCQNVPTLQLSTDDNLIAGIINSRISYDGHQRCRARRKAGRFPRLISGTASN